MLRGLLLAMRPHQWTKNVFVLAPLVFAQALVDRTAVLRALGAFAAFCLASSAVYLFNDVQDREKDRHHPTKKNRPIAAGIVPPSAALVLSALLATAAVVICWRLSGPLASVVGFYLLLNIGYSSGLKKIVILDALIVSMGFVLRVLGGGQAIGVQVSAWLLLCTVLVSLLLALSKRRHELTLLERDAAEQRQVLSQYSPTFLDQMINVVTASTVVAYALYAVSPETAERFQTEHLVYTLPFVLYGIFRYLYLIYQGHSTRNPTEAILVDKPFLSNIALWAVAVVWIIYGA